MRQKTIFIMLLKMFGGLKSFKMDKKKFKKQLKLKTGCSVQHNGWTCGTCFFAISERLSNRDWRAVLYYRGDYSLKELNAGLKNPLTEGEIQQRIEMIWELIK